MLMFIFDTKLNPAIYDAVNPKDFSNNKECLGLKAQHQ